MPSTSELAPRRFQRDLFAWTLLASVLLCGAMAIPFFQGQVPTSDDLWAYHLPTRDFYAQCLKSGERFDWMPHLYAGFYLTGEGQAGTYHPLHWALYRWLPLGAAFNLELLLSYPLMLAGMYVFLRPHVRRRDAALFGAMVFTFSGFCTLHFVHPNAVAVVAHIPWLLAATRVMLTSIAKSRRWMAGAAIALLTASQLLLGYPQYVWFSLLAEAAYALYLRPLGARGVSCNPMRKRGSETSSETLAHAAGYEGDCQECRMSKEGAGKRPRLVTSLLVFVGLAAFKVLGLAMAAVQVLPTLDALAESERSGADAAFAVSGSLHPANAAQFVGPYLFEDRVAGGNTHEFGAYIGAVPLLLIVWLAIRWKHVRRKRFAKAAAVFSVVAFVLALGQYGGLYYLQSVLPVVGKFRIPARYLVLVHLGTACLAAVAFADLVGVQASACFRRRAAGSRSTASAYAPINLIPRYLALVGVGAALLAPLLWPEHVAAMPWRLVGPLLLSLAVVLMLLASQGRKAAAVALVLFTAIDLGAYGFSYAVFPNAHDLNAAIGGVPSAGDGHGRIAAQLRDPADALRNGNQLVLQGARQVDGYAGLEPRRELDYRQVAALRAAGVEMVLRSDSSDGIEGLTVRDAVWREVPDPMPRAWLVGQAIPSGEPARDLETIDLRTTALVSDQSTAADLSQFPPSHGPGGVGLRADRPGELQLRVSVPTPRLLVTTERFHHGWQAAVNGQPREVLRVNGEFIGCLVLPGERDVRFTFDPASLRCGKQISLIGLAVLVVVVGVGLFRNRKRIDEHIEPTVE